MLEGIYFCRQTFANGKYQIHIQVQFHLPIYPKDWLCQIYSPTLYCTECLLMYSTFVKSQIEFWTKVDPLWYSFSLWSEYFDIVLSPREPFPVPRELDAITRPTHHPRRQHHHQITSVTINLTGSLRGRMYWSAHTFICKEFFQLISSSVTFVIANSNIFLSIKASSAWKPLSPSCLLEHSI